MPYEKRALRIERDDVRASIGWTYEVQGSGRRMPVRGEITRFSARARARMSAYLRACTARYEYLGTLTCRDWGRDGRVFKDALNRYLKRKLLLMQNAARRSPAGGYSDPSIFWFLEFQARGAPHVHYLYTHPVAWQQLASYWAESLHQPEIAGTSTKFEKIRGGRAAMLSYVIKYARKEAQKDVPADFHNVGRFWGIRGCRETLSAAKVIRTDYAHLLVRSEVKDMLRALRASGKVRIVQWPNGEGVLIYAKPGESLTQIGLVAALDRVMLVDTDIRMGTISALNRRGS